MVVVWDRMLETVVRRDALRLHLAAGFPPMLEVPRKRWAAGRIPLYWFADGSWSPTCIRELMTKPLTTDDVSRLVIELTSKEDLEDCDSRGGTSFDFMYGTEHRFHARLTKQGQEHQLSVTPVWHKGKL